MARKSTALLLALGLILGLAGCSSQDAQSESDQNTSDATDIALSDDGVTVDGEDAPTDAQSAVYVGADIVYYQSGQDESYGDGTEDDAHSAEEAAAHTVVTITQPGTYRVSGTLSAGQIAVDLGEDASQDPDAVVDLILDNADITCTVAPAIIFYNVYECGSTNADTASGTVDTSAAGANVTLAEGSTNTVTGSHVAQIYQEGTMDKLHKYDGALYSKMSMNIDGAGSLSIVADNEGLCSELHLTINGGNIDISSQNDGINTNENGVSVTTINDGTLHINGGLGTEGDGIDSNGFITINGGEVYTMSKDNGADGGIDADESITINGGTLIALGSRNDIVDSSSGQPYMDLQFASVCAAGSTVSIQNENGEEIISFTAEKSFQSLTLSSPELALDTVYSVYVDDVQQQYTATGTANFGAPPADGQPPQDDGTPPDGESPSNGEASSDSEEPVSDSDAPSENDDNQTSQGGDLSQSKPSSSFVLTEENKSFSGISAVEAQ